MVIDLNIKSLKGWVFVLSIFLTMITIPLGIGLLLSSYQLKIHLLYGFLTLFIGSFSLVFLISFTIFLYRHIKTSLKNISREKEYLSLIEPPKFLYKLKAWFWAAFIPSILTSFIALFDQIHEVFNIIIVYVWLLSMIITLVIVFIVSRTNSVKDA